VLPLAQHFLDFFVARRTGGPKKRLSPETENLLLNYNWPGNVRELRNVMERGAVLSADTLIGPEFLPEAIRYGQGHVRSPVGQPRQSIASVSPPSPVVPIKELERKAIIEALSYPANNASKAAKQLGISRANLYRKLKNYGILETD